MSTNILQFVPKPRSGDPDFPGIAELAHIQGDGGKKSRILRKRDNFKFRNFAEPIIDNRDDLLMDHADPGMPSDSAFVAPDFDAS